MQGFFGHTSNLKNALYFMIYTKNVQRKSSYMHNFNKGSALSVNNFIIDIII